VSGQQIEGLHCHGKTHGKIKVALGRKELQALAHTPLKVFKEAFDPIFKPEA
jgi:hypothetical protein